MACTLGLPSTETYRDRLGEASYKRARGCGRQLRHLGDLDLRGGRLLDVREDGEVVALLVGRHDVLER